MKQKTNSLPLSIVIFLGVAVALLTFYSLPSQAQSKVPRYEVDPSWPKPLPNLWVTGGVAGVCVDSHDHVFILNRQDVADNYLDAGRQAPPVIEFDPEGNVVNSFGDPDALPIRLHGCTIDQDGNIWLAGARDGMIQEYTHDGGKLLLQIGKRGVVDSSDGTFKGKPLNSSHTQFFGPAAVVIDPKNRDIYVADGEAINNNHRIAVFDHTGQFLRQWDLHREESDGDAYLPVVHSVAMSNDGWVYVCDRRGHRLQVFDRMGNFQKNIPIKFEPRSPLPPGPDHKSGAEGSAVWASFSSDPQQKLMFVTNQDNEEIEIVERTSGNVMSSFGRVGHQLGEFTNAHFLAVDSRNDVYVAEVGEGKRVQKFRPTGIR